MPDERPGFSPLGWWLAISRAFLKAVSPQGSATEGLEFDIGTPPLLERTTRGEQMQLQAHDLEERK